MNELSELIDFIRIYAEPIGYIVIGAIVAPIILTGFIRLFHQITTIK